MDYFEMVGPPVTARLPPMAKSEEKERPAQAPRRKLSMAFVSSKWVQRSCVCVCEFRCFHAHRRRVECASFEEFAALCGLFTVC